MKDNNNIEELFRDGLKDFESPVDPSVWSAIESNLGASAGSAASTGAGGLGLGKIAAIVGIAVASVATVGYLVYTSSSDEKSNEETNIVNNDNQSDAQTIEKTTTPNTKNATPENNEKVVEHSTSKPEFVDIPLKPKNRADQSEGETPEQTEDNTIGNTSASVQGNASSGNQNDNNANHSQGGNSATSGTNNLEEKEYVAPKLNIIIAETEGEAPYMLEYSANSSETEVNWIIYDESNREIYNSTGLSGKVELNAGQYLVEAKITDERGESAFDQKFVEVFEPVVAEESLEFAEHLYSGSPDTYVLLPYSSGKNKLEYEKVPESISEYSILIQSRSGEIVFSSASPLENWDGANRKTGQLVPKGQYYATIMYIGSSGKTIKLKRTIIVTY